MVIRMKNYYEILEISENASQEVVERVYKLLAKKYHPDLNPENPKEAEERFKSISEAYEVLSNDAKRHDYDNELKRQRESQIYNSSDTYSSFNVDYSEINEKVLREMQADLARQRQAVEKQRIEQENKLRKEYNDAYISALEQAGIHVVYKRNLKEIAHDTFNTIKGLFFTIIVFILICIAIWVIPPTHDKIVSMYENGGLLKSIVELFSE